MVKYGGHGCGGNWKYLAYKFNGQVHHGLHGRLRMKKGSRYLLYNIAMILKGSPATAERTRGFLDSLEPTP